MPRAHLDTLLNSDTGQQDKGIFQETQKIEHGDTTESGWLYLALPGFSLYQTFISRGISHVLSYDCLPPVVLSFFVILQRLYKVRREKHNPYKVQHSPQSVIIILGH